MGIFDKFERKLEGAVSGVFARAFRSSVEPVEIASELEHELERHAAVVTRERTIVPNDFHVELSPNDYDRLASMGVSLAAEFVGVLQEHAQQQRYAFTGPVRVALEREDDLDTGLFRIRSEVKTAPAVPVAPPPPPVSRPPPASSQDAEADRPYPTKTFARREVNPLPRRPEPPPIYLEISGRRYDVRPPGAMLGRASDCDVRIDDPGASRQHAEIRLVPIGREVSVQIVDLGSTNGTRVDGKRIDTAELRDGSTITIGNTTVAVVVGRR